MSHSNLEPAGSSAEDRREWTAFSTRVKVNAQRRQWMRGLAFLKVLRALLLVGGIVTFALCSTPFLADIGQRLPAGTQLYLDMGLLLSAGCVLAPVWMKGNFARVRGEIKKLDDEQEALGVAGLKLYEEAKRRVPDKF